MKKTSAKRRGAGSDDVGKALRSAYDEALREEVPDDFLDLLGKLS
ncbi:NepR family anti-sigma factor [Sphingomonas sp. LHG3406-1]|nr:NepR family anti-sigma factor [Sphingomonas sp. LHG3406-1]